MHQRLGVLAIPFILVVLFFQNCGNIDLLSKNQEVAEVIPPVVAPPVVNTCTNCSVVEFSSTDPEAAGLRNDNANSAYKAPHTGLKLYRDKVTSIRIPKAGKPAGYRPTMVVSTSVGYNQPRVQLSLTNKPSDQFLDPEWVFQNRHGGVWNHLSPAGLSAGPCEMVVFPGRVLDGKIYWHNCDRPEVTDAWYINVRFVYRSPEMPDSPLKPGALGGNAANCPADLKMPDGEPACEHNLYFY